jgi:hypothetical protein
MNMFIFTEFIFLRLRLEDFILIKGKKSNLSREYIEDNKQKYNSFWVKSHVC